MLLKEKMKRFSILQSSQFEQLLNFLLNNETTYLSLSIAYSRVSTCAYVALSLFRTLLYKLTCACLNIEAILDVKYCNKTSKRISARIRGYGVVLRQAL